MKFLQLNKKKKVKSEFIQEWAARYKKQNWRNILNLSALHFELYFLSLQVTAVPKGFHDIYEEEDFPAGRANNEEEKK